MLETLTFVEAGVSLDVFISLSGPYATGAHGLPRATNATAMLFASLVSPMRASADLSGTFEPAGGWRRQQGVRVQQARALPDQDGAARPARRG